MWSVTIHSEVNPIKRKEYRQTLDMLIKEVQLYRGCLRGQYTVDAVDENKFEVTFEWKSKNAVDDYLGSHIHKVLNGAIRTLCEDHSITIMQAANNSDAL